MTKSIYLDPSKLAPLKPFEGDVHNGSWISPFDVPKYAQAFVDDFGSIRGIRFEYNGGETGDVTNRRPLDDKSSPDILVLHGRNSGKILEMTFGQPIRFIDLPTIAERLSREAATAASLSRKFNYLMISGIFKHWTEMVERVD